ncbi:MAG: UDP-N-acetylmuramate dehydrogenase [Bacteroidales bacterium]|nr:UDP-N-acetylmuramate dehydrogenase [Bacteroidales bacterium]
MRRIIKKFNLKKFNTFGIEVIADYFFAFTDIIDLKSFLKNDLYNHLDKQVLGGGSNILLTKDFKGVIIHPFCKDIVKKKTTSNSYLIKADAGVNWDSFVEKCVENNWYGLENLSGIPGKVGAAPIQNIGAYGVELKDFIEKIETINLETHELEIFYHDQCNFGYRDSIFKQSLKGKHVITAVYFSLLKEPNLITNYKAVEEELNKIGPATAQNLRKAILNIRESKLPKPIDFPNAGSFFKNPIISLSEFKKIKSKNPEIPHYIESDKKVKIPAAWLIEQCGFKGYKNGKVAVHDKQALVIINTGGANAQDILNLADKICSKVKKTFGIQLEKEINLI